jgi:hypothetical protein
MRLPALTVSTRERAWAILKVLGSNFSRLVPVLELNRTQKRVGCRGAAVDRKYSVITGKCWLLRKVKEVETWVKGYSAQFCY